MKTGKILRNRKKLAEKTRSLKKAGKKIVFTNGCYDIIHAGHVRFLRRAKKSGDILLVALNSDSSVRRIKGKKRPITPQAERMEVMAAFSSVDIVTLFCEDDPYKIINDIKPNVLVKGGDWKTGDIIGSDIVKKNRGSVKSVKYEEGRSTTGIIDKVIKNYG